MNLKEEALALHRRHPGKIEVAPTVPLRDARDLTLAYSPGVAEACRAIQADPEQIYSYTSRGNMVAVVSDGTAVLGLGDIGPEGALPVMEGKAILFKTFAGVDAFPICLNTKDPGEIVETVTHLAPNFGGINLEDISAPRCFTIEQELKSRLDIPVFHDDQHGTAVVSFAALLNALRIVDKSLNQVRVVINGAGAAGVAIARLLLLAGVGDIILCDRRGAIVQGRDAEMNPIKTELAAITNIEKRTGTLGEVLAGADVFIGVSAAGVLKGEMVRRMHPGAVIFALANPDPEIWPEEALAAGARVVATGRSDMPNQVNNVLGFPGIFRGALDVRARSINEEMKKAAAKAIADLVGDDLREDYIIPAPFDPRVAPAVAAAVAEAAMNSNVARITCSADEVAEHVKKLVHERTAE